MATKCKVIVTHREPHIDEITGIWMLKKFGQGKYPGVETAKIVFWSPDAKLSDESFDEDLRGKGVIAIGVAGGIFDEHPTLRNIGKEGECATTLVAKDLGMNEDPALEKILKFVTDNDVKASGGHPFDLSAVAKAMYRQRQPVEVINWVLAGLDVKYEEQRKFHEQTSKEFEKARIDDIQWPNRTLKVASVESDDPLINRFARSSYGCNAAVVIQRNSTGNVQIYTDKRVGVKMYDVAQMLRIAEQEAQGELKITDWRELSRAGGMAGVEEWYFHEEGQLLLNGSLTTKNKPTRLSLEQIREIILTALTPDAFEPERCKICLTGKCTSTRENQCPWYKWGLHRCRQLRSRR